MKSYLKVFINLIILILVVACVSFSTFAIENDKQYSSIKVCANMGNLQQYIGNGTEAVKSCDADFISFDIQTLDDTLLNIINAKEKKQVIVLDVKLEDVKAVYNYLKLNNKLENVKIRIEKCKTKDISALINENEDFRNLLIPVYNGNIIFSAENLISTAKKENLNIIQLGTKNKNGVILYNSFTESFKENKLSAMFSFVSEYNANRNDDVSGWDNAISQGYSIIETNYPELLNEYLKNRDSYYEKLLKLTNSCESALKDDFSQESKNNFNDAYNNAVACLEHPSSLSEISTAFTDLSDAYNNLQPKGTDEIAGKFTFSFGKVIAVILCGGGIVLSQIYLFKKRSK